MSSTSLTVAQKMSTTAFPLISDYQSPEMAAIIRMAQTQIVDCQQREQRDLRITALAKNAIVFFEQFEQQTLARIESVNKAIQQDAIGHERRIAECLTSVTQIDQSTMKVREALKEFGKTRLKDTKEELSQTAKERIALEAEAKRLSARLKSM